MKITTTSTARNGRIDLAMDSMSGLTSQPALGSILSILKNNNEEINLDEEQIKTSSLYWEQVRQNYKCFETDFKGGSSDVYYHQMPGGQFTNLPEEYPEEAWYHYDDWTCDYQCMAIEYLYWCIVSHMGILDDVQTCNGIANEWEPCTPELFESTDVIMHGLITNPMFKIPQLAPDGNYCPNAYISGDINEDGTVNILDVILTINIILGIDEINQLADLNNDGEIDVLDIVQIINIILSD